MSKQQAQAQLMARLHSASLRSAVSLLNVRTLVVADRKAAAVVALVVALGSGLATSFVAPRGPTSTADALFVMALVLVVGTLGGVLARARWVLLPLVLAYVVGVELGRINVVASTLDIRFDSTYGILACVLTRFVHGLLAFPTLTFGVLAGIAYAHRIGWLPDRPRRRPPVGSALIGVAVVALAVLVALPASTPPVLGADGKALPGSVAELTTVRLGGQDQAVMIRAASPDKPVLLYLSGGPGQSDLALARAQVSGWEHEFVFATLDQRGNGKSYGAIGDVSSMTLERAVSDVIELTDYLRARFGEKKVYLMGESWGTILGVLAVQRRPDLYYAWIGSGQMVDIVETDRRIYDDLVAYAKRAGDAGLASKLAEIGRPPYRDIPWANANLLAWYDYLYADYTPSAGYVARGAASGLDPFGVLGSEYTLVEKTDVLRGLIDTFALMYPQLYDLDFRQSVQRLDVPVYILDGKAELAGRRDLMLDWFGMLQAPTKQRVTYENAAHAVAFEQADQVQKLLTETIVPATYVQ